MIARGLIVEVDDAGAPLLVRVLGVSGPRLLVELADGSTRQVRRSEVTTTVGPSADLAAGLAAIDHCARLAAEALPRLWAYALEAGGDPVSVEQLLEQAPTLREAPCDPWARYALYAAVRDDSLYFRPAADAWRPRPREEVSETIARREMHQRAVVCRQAMAERLREALTGARLPAELRAAVEGIAGAEDIVAGLIDRAAQGNGGRERTEAAEVLRLVEQAEGMLPGALDGAEERLLRALGVLGEHELLALHRERIRTVFPAEVETAALALVARGAAGGLPPATGVLDLREREAFTIDSEETDDRDDAFSVHPTAEGVEVGVHITTPAAWLDPADPVVAEAIRRGTTLYLPDQVLPMMPAQLGRALLYLDEGVERRTLTLLTPVSADGTPGAPRLVLADVRVRHNLTWAQAQSYLPAEAPPPGVGPEPALRDRSTGSGTGLGEGLAVLLAAARRMAAHREHWGATRVALPELRWRARGEGHAVSLHRYDPGDVARLLVSEWMIHFNTAVGAWAAREGVPVVYRWQKPPRTQEEFGGAVAAGASDPLWRALKQVRGMRRAEMGLEPLRHAGLGVDAYAPTTSPLRRAADLLGHLNLWSALQGAEPVLPADRLESVLSEVRASVDSATSVAREAERYWGLRWLAGRVGLEHEVLVTGVESGSRGRAMAVLVESLQRVWLAPRFSTRVGERLWVRLERVDPDTGEVGLRPL